MALAPATRLGPYEILAPLGAGGMGEVYRARDTRLERTVAIKILPAQFSSDAVRKQRFEREAKTISSLNHPHICVLHDVGHQDGVDYLVMECVEGETLAERLEKGPLPLEQVLRLGAQIADALNKAHRSGIVHRDLKPGNIMLAPTGAKLLDFGLAKAAAPVNAATLTAAAKPATPVTQEGAIVGTFQYMSPEQVEGKEVDSRSDIFSLGAVLYEMVTGRRAFQGKSPLSVASAILEKDPAPIGSIKPLTPPALDHAIRRCLAKEPERRWQSAADLAGELQWVAEAGSQAGVAVFGMRLGKQRERLGWVAAAALAIIAMSAAVGWWRDTRHVLRPLIRISSDLAPGPFTGTYRIDETILANGGTGTFLALSPDGSRLAVLISDAHGNLRLATRRLDENQFKVLAGAENPTSPFFSPDGQWIAFFGNGTLNKIPAQGGASVQLCDAEGFPSGSWGDDGNIIAALRWNGPLSLVPSTGGAPTPVTELKTGEIWHRWPQVLPGSRAVLFTASTGGGPEGSSIDILSFKTHERKTVIRGGVMGRYLVASNGAGYLVYLHQSTLLAAPFDISNLAVTGAAQPLLDDVTAFRLNFMLGIPGDFDFSRNGTFVYLSGKGEPERSIFWLDHAGKTAPLHPTPGFYRDMHFSPDGKRLVFVARGGPGQPELWVKDLERNTLTRLPSFPGSGASPVWSPDGKHILFAAGQPNAGIYWTRSDGAEEPQKVAEAGMGEPHSFSPEGKRVAIASNSRFTPVEIWTVPVEGAPDHPLLGKKELFLRARGFLMPAFSPDGRWIAYSSVETGTPEIYVQPFPGPGGKVPISAGGGLFPTWSANGRELFFCTVDRRIMVVDYTARNESFSPGKPRLWSPQQILFDAGGGPAQPYALAPDGKRFAVMLYPDGTTGQHNPLHLTFLLNFSDELRRRVPAE